MALDLAQSIPGGLLLAARAQVRDIGVEELPQRTTVADYSRMLLDTGRETWSSIWYEVTRAVTSNAG